MKFNEKLKSLRIKNNETQIDLANHLNITFQSVSKWEKGVCLPNIEIIKDIANHYNVSLDSLLLDYEDVKEININDNIDETVKKYHPTINEETYFCVFLDKGNYRSYYAHDRYRTASKIPQRASQIKNNYVVAVNELGKIIYMAKSTGYGYGSPCDKFYHQCNITEARNIDCFYLLPSYSPYGDGTNHYFDWEFVIPKNGFVMIIAENSFEFKSIFGKYHTTFNSFNFFNCPDGCLDELTLKIEDNTLFVSERKDNKEKLKDSLSNNVIEALFKEYIRNNKDEIINLIKDELSEELNDQISEAYDFAQEAMDFAQEAMDLAQEVSDRVDNLEDK